MDGTTMHSHSFLTETAAAIAFVWYLIVVGVSLTGALVIWLKNSQVSASPPPLDAEGVTILRPMKGIDPEMDECLISALQQQYPRFEVIFCAESEGDAAIGPARRLIDRFPNVDAKVMISSTREHYGPNPKVNNLAKGFTAAKYDILWVLDSNAWVSPGTLARSIAQLNTSPKTQVVHHLPLSISLNGIEWGAKLDEMFMCTSHSKFYRAINATGLDPCVMGKSNIYRRSVLDAAVAAKLKLNQKHMEPGTGIRHFAQYIAEDNMIAKCIWDSGGRTAMTSDVVVQPLTKFSLTGYCERRIRWLRVRRYMVLAATLVEPTTESLVAGVLGSFSISVLFLSSTSTLRTWSWTWFLFHMLCWVLIDYWHFHNLLQFSQIESIPGTSKPAFVQPYYNPYDTTQPPGHQNVRSLATWLPVWVTREVLALPIWVAAMCGQTIYWRGRPFRIREDMSTEELATW